jgi:putative proteasome-type protease
MSDTRTNAGIDNVSMFKKMHTWSVPGERIITLLSAGNLATTQAVISMLDERTKAVGDRNPSILELPSLFQVARLVGEIIREEIRTNGAGGQNAVSTFNASVIIGGQIKGHEPRLFLVYPEGNFIEASAETPFFQIGETKYGKPILVRAYDPELSFEDAIKLMLVSFDSTIKANLSVGLPLDVQCQERDALRTTYEHRISADDPYFSIISTGWGNALREAFHSLPPYEM